jgi:acyl-CoA reductase-like NAD-dependent aldehyde dehydrogenase
MPSKAQISIPLIIDGVDVYLTDEQFTFSPQSQSDSSIANGRVLAQGADTASCHAAVDSCARAFDTWRRTSASQRRTHFLCLAELLRAKETEIRRIIEEEIYATSMWSQINFDDSVLLIEEMAALVTSHVLSGTIPQAQDPESQALVLTEPLGVILWIAPWNSPLVLGFRAVAGAIAAGNTAILKGSELSPRTHYFIVSLFREAGFPPGVCNFLLHCESDGAHVFATIIDRHEVRKCNFTGSTPVGRMIASRAAKALKPSLLELGGKNFAVVLEDADVDKTARLIAEGAFLNVCNLWILDWLWHWHSAFLYLWRSPN